VKPAGFRDVGKRLDTFDFDFNKKMHRALVFELATARWVTQHDDALFLGPPESATYYPPRYVRESPRLSCPADGVCGSAPPRLIAATVRRTVSSSRSSRRIAHGA